MKFNDFILIVEDKTNGLVHAFPFQGNIKLISTSYQSRNLSCSINGVYTTESFDQILKEFYGMEFP